MVTFGGATENNVFFLLEKDVFLTARRRKKCFLLIEKDVFFRRDAKSRSFRAAEGGA